MILNETYERIHRCKSLLQELEAHQKEPNKFDALVESLNDRLRSITWIFQKEMKNKHPGLEDWYKKKREEMKKPENSLLSFFIQARNVSTKEKPLTLASARACFFNDIPEFPNIGNTNSSLAHYAEKDKVRIASRKEVGRLMLFLLFFLYLQFSVLY